MTEDLSVEVADALSTVLTDDSGEYTPEDRFGVRIRLLIHSSTRW